MQFRVAVRVASMLLVILCLAGCRPQPKGVGGPVGAQFAKARDLVHRAEFAPAQQALDRFLTEHPEHELASRAHFLKAKTHLGLNDLQNATLEFEATIRSHPSSEEAHKSKFKLAMLAVLQDDIAQAVQLLKALQGDAGAYAPEVEAWLAKLQDQVEPDPR